MSKGIESTGPLPPVASGDHTQRRSAERLADITERSHGGVSALGKAVGAAGFEVAKSEESEQRPSVEIGSQIDVDHDDGTFTYMLVARYDKGKQELPPDVDELAESSPLGAALVGQREGAEVNYTLENGTKKTAAIVKIYQPEQ